jgi:hypothetical protein
VDISSIVIGKQEGLYWMYMKKHPSKRMLWALPYITPVPPAVGGAPADQAIGNITLRLIDLLFLIGGVFAILYLLWAGIQYITSNGNTDKMKSARQAIIAVVVGIIVMMSAFFIIRLATSFGWTASQADKPATP